MKCAAVTISSRRVREVRRSIVASNQAGVSGSKKDTRTVRGVEARRYAFVARCQNGCGWRTGGSCVEAVHGARGVGRSQRLLPMITEDEPPAIVYASRSGATAR